MIAARARMAVPFREWSSSDEGGVVSAIAFRLNGRPVTVEAGGGRMLLWVLRTDFSLTGSKYGCGSSLCGACTVVVDGEAVRSCELPLESVQGKDVTTIEGLEHGGRLHPLQQAFIDHGALQCGYCTPGMLMSAYALLKKRPGLGREAIAQAMEDHLCRCGAHGRILDAIAEVSAKGGRP